MGREEERGSGGAGEERRLISRTAAGNRAYLTFCFEFYNHHILTKQPKNICIEEKVIIRINFNPGLALRGFQTNLPCFQQVDLT